MAEAETIEKASGSGVTFITADGECKTLEEYCDEEEEKEKDKEAQEEQELETGFARRRTIYRGPNDRVKTRAGNPQKLKVYTQEEINTTPIFHERNLKLMTSDSKTPLIQLVIMALSDGGWYTPARIAEKLVEANPNCKADASNVSWRLSQLRNSPVKLFVEKRLSETGHRVNEYSFARCVIVNLKPTEIYQLYRKSNRDITPHSIAARFPDVAAYLDKKGRKDNWSGAGEQAPKVFFEKPVEPEPEITEPLVNLAENIKQTIAKQTGLDVNINGRVEIVFKFALERGE